MAEYYLISQLPSLDGIGENTPLPIDEERFLELCGRFLGKKTLKEIEKLTILPSVNAEKTSSALLNAWYEGERNLRRVLAKARAEKLKKTFDLQNTSFPSGFEKAASVAVDFDNPLEAENFLYEFRLNYLESLRPMNTFSEEFIFYYGLKLKLIMRMRKFDAKLGETAYKNIYNSILNGEKLEAIK